MDAFRIAQGVTGNSRAQIGILLSLLLAPLSACTAVPPASDPSSAPSKEPGEPFADNVCFQCALRSCSVSASACTQQTTCADWLDCVSSCPTNASGVAAEGDCLAPCGLPLSAEVLFGCVQDFSSGFLLGCEQPCTPL